MIPVEALSSAIYCELFGQTRDQLIAHARTLPGWYDSVEANMGDMDEAIRDYMSIEALEALGTVEHKCTDALFDTMPRTVEEAIPVIQRVARFYRQKVGVVPLWQMKNKPEDI